jgi:hypothetical protein
MTKRKAPEEELPPIFNLAEDTFRLIVEELYGLEKKAVRNLFDTSKSLRYCYMGAFMDRLWFNPNTKIDAVKKIYYKPYDLVNPHLFRSLEALELKVTTISHVSSSWIPSRITSLTITEVKKVKDIDLSFLINLKHLAIGTEDKRNMIPQKTRPTLKIGSQKLETIFAKGVNIIGDFFCENAKNIRFLHVDVITGFKLQHTVDAFLFEWTNFKGDMELARGKEVKKLRTGCELQVMYRKTMSLFALKFEAVHGADFKNPLFRWTEEDIGIFTWWLQK